MFKNAYDYTRGGVHVSYEDYLNYKDYTKTRHEFADMLYHEAEVAAVFLAEKGIVEKTDNFYPDHAVSVKWFCDAVEVLGGTPSADLDLSQDRTLTMGEMAQLLTSVCEGVGNENQYLAYVSSIENVSDVQQKALAMCVALGLIRVSGELRPSSGVTRAQAALALFRMAEPAMRLVAPYDIGSAVKNERGMYLVKNTHKLNEGGLQLGTWANYNWQRVTFEKLGKRPIDRVDFHKWCFQEKTKGEYTFPEFGNEQRSAYMGCTVVTSVEISANLIWNPKFHRNHIPEFYETDITNPETRDAAKRYLYAFVQAMLKNVKGDIMLAIDYEIDWEMGILWEPDAAARERARIWGDWYVEACEVSRKAAADMGAADRLRLIAIYNNVTDMHKLGKDKNEWMVKVAEASDVVGIDVYFYEAITDKTVADCAKQLIQDMRFLINNYSLGKPVMIIENGGQISERLSEEGMANYFSELFREFRFALPKGQYLDGNLNAYMFWDMFRFEGCTGVFKSDCTPYPAGLVIQREFALMESIRCFNPTVQTAVEDVGDKSEISINVNSGTDYQSLTLVAGDVSDKTALKVGLKNEGTAFITVNGEYHYACKDIGTEHIIPIPCGLSDKFNCIKIYFGGPQKPFEQTVTDIELV